MKKLLLILPLFTLIFMGQSCIGEDEAIEDVVVNETAEEEEKICHLLGAWKFTMTEGDITIVVDSTFNDDGSKGEITTCVGTVDSTHATVTKAGEALVGETDLTPDYGLYELTDDQITLRKAWDNTTVATGTLTSPTTASGTWNNPNTGTSGAWTAEKVSDL